MKEESLKRLGHQTKTPWRPRLLERLKWHDVIIWLLLPMSRTNKTGKPLSDGMSDTELAMCTSIILLSRDTDEKKFWTYCEVLNHNDRITKAA